MSSTRVTISDVAEGAGVSTGAVSLAINGRRGVSDKTRLRVLAVAEELGWAPSSAARSLMEAKTETFGLAIARGPAALGVDSFFVRFITGLESELAKRSYSLLLQVVPDVETEVESHRRWRATRRVDGLILVDGRLGDPRIKALESGDRIPVVMSGDPSVAGDLANVWTDDASAMQEAVAYLSRLGHRRIARVSGIAGFGHTEIRNSAFEAQCRAFGVEGSIVATDYSVSSGASATRQLLSRRDRPTAVIYDNDIMAMSGVSVAAEMGISVPASLSIVAWDDSPISELTFPSLTAVGHDVIEHGASVARCLFDLLDGAEPASYLVSTPHLIVRGSTAPPDPAV